MDIRSRVFFCQEPLMRRRDGSIVSRIDMSKSAKYGPPVFVLRWNETAVVEPFPVALIWKVREGMASFTSDDYLLAVGDPSVIQLCGIIAAELTDGRFRILQWDNKLLRYDVVSLDIHCQPL